MVNKPSRGNSFDIHPPKDDYELIKSKDPSSPSHRSKSPVHFNGFPEDVTSAPVVVGDVKKKQHKKQTVSKQFSQDILETMSPAKLVETVKQLALNEQEIQVLVNELLNREGEDASSSWSSKNDPQTALKKSLAETEAALRTERSNLESTLIRVKELREELALERKQSVSARETAKRLETELAKSAVYIQQMKQDISSLNSSLQTKKNEEMAVVTRLQEENRRLKEVVNKFEAERESIPRLKQELDQLRSERQQSNSLMKQLKEENHNFKEHVQSLTNSLQQEEYSLKQKLNELANQLKDKDQAACSANKDLQEANSKLLQLDSQYKSQMQELTASLTQTQSALEAVNNKINDLTSENEQLKHKLNSLEGSASEVNSLQLTLDEKVKEIERLLSLLKESEEEKKQMESALNKSQVDLVSKQELDEKEKELKAVEAVKESLSQEVSSLKKSLSDLESTVSSVTRLVSKSFPETTPASLVPSLESLLKSLHSQPTNENQEELVSVRQQLQEQMDVNVRLQQDLDSLKTTVSCLQIFLYFCLLSH